MGRHIGIYGGSFDPIHLGHVSFAVGMMEAHQLDEVWFCPTYINPHKENQKAPASPEHRYNMLQLAIEGEPRFHILDIELSRPQPSFTIDTLHLLLERQKKLSDPDKFSLILGDDAAKSFFSWKQPEEIIALADLLVGCRFTHVLNYNDWQGSPRIKEAIKKGVTPTRIMEMSSTEIRDRLLKKMYCGHLLQRKVLDYIQANHLYST